MKCEPVRTTLSENIMQVWMLVGVRKPVPNVVATIRAMERLIITYRKRQMGQPITVASRFLKELAA